MLTNSFFPSFFSFLFQIVLERHLQLTDSYRFGVLQSDRPSPSSELLGETDLWTRGALVAEAALRHPALTSLFPILSTASTLSPEAAPPLLSRTRTGSTSTADPTRPSLSPRRTISRSYAHPSTSVPAVVSFVPSSYQPVTSHHLPPQLKLALTIQIHLYYLLALQTWPVDPPASEELWHRIILIAERNGGQVGTKEGDEIISKTVERLRVVRGEQGSEVDDWKFSKEKKRKSSLDAVVGSTGRKNSAERSVILSGGGIAGAIRKVRNEEVGAGEELQEVVGGSGEGEEEGDALAEIWRKKWENVEADKGRKRKLSSSSSSVKTKVPLVRKKKEEDRSADSNSKLTSTPSKSFSNVNPVKFNRAPPSTNSFEAVAPSSSLVASPCSVPTPAPITSSSSIKTSKFHFAVSSSTDYPSPPDTPNPSPPGSRRMTTDTEISFDPLPLPSPFVEEPEQEEDLSRTTQLPPLLPPIPFPKVRRASSNSSFQPPSLLPRIRSSSSISTLPPDFFSARNGSRTRAVTGSHWSKTSAATVDSGSSNDLPGLSKFTYVPSPMGRSDVLDNDNENGEEARGSIGWRKKFNSLRGSLASKIGPAVRPGIPDFNPFKLLAESREKKAKSAIEVLKTVLKRDDDSAGVGMYWADRSVLEEEEIEEDFVDENGELIPSVQMEDSTISTLSFEDANILAPSASSSRPSGNGSPATSTSRRGSNGTEMDDSISELPHKRTLRSPRSFIDVTTSRQSSQCPVKVIYTPATPDHHTSSFGVGANTTIANGRPALSKLTTRSTPSLHPHSSSTTPSTPSSSSSAIPSPLANKSPKLIREVGIDPLLLELERKSRVGVRTVCVTCGKKGLNFPACRNGRTFCSRECRVGPASGLGAVDVMGKGKGKESVGV